MSNNPNASMGFAAQVGMGASIPVTEKYEFVEFDFGKESDLGELMGIRGTRAHFDDRVRKVRELVSGGMHLQPTVVELRKLLPRILGGAESGSNPYTYAVAETLPTFAVQADRVTTVHNYASVVVDRAMFRGGEGGVLELTLAMEGLAEASASAGTFPSLTIDCTQGPFTFREGVLTLNSVQVYMKSFEVSVDNQLKKDRYFNSLTRLSLPPTDRIVMFSCVLPNNADTIALYDAADPSISGTSSLVFTHGSQVFTITLRNLRFPTRRNLPLRGKQDEILLSLTGQSRQDCSGNTEITCSLTA